MAESSEAPVELVFLPVVRLSGLLPDSTYPNEMIWPLPHHESALRSAVFLCSVFIGHQLRMETDAEAEISLWGCSTLTFVFNKI